MGQADYLALGDWNAVCFVCGRKFKASQLRKHWQGYYVCEQDWEPRQPQDFVKNVPDIQTPPWTQPMPPDTYTAFCSPGGSSSFVDRAVVDCVTPDYVWPGYDPILDETT